LWDSCVRVDGTFRTIPTVGILRGGSFLFPPKPIAVKLLDAAIGRVPVPYCPGGRHG